MASATDDQTAPSGEGSVRAPVVWLVGKVQSGKTSVIRTLTGAADAEIGDGFRACTRSSVIFDFPAAASVIRFLDTRGLGEAGYDPAEDIAFCETQSHLVLATMRAMDVQQDVVMATLTETRRRHPTWPIVIAQTTLHEGYTRRGHVLPYPFDAQGAASDAVAAGLARSLRTQRAMFATLPGTGAIRFAPIDFTRADDGLEPADYGLAELKRALSEAAPLALAAVLADEHLRSGDGRARTAHASILRYALAAAAIDLVPVAGLVAVPGVQAKMLHTISLLYSVEWNRRIAAEFAAALGTGTVVSTLGGFGLRQLAKLIPVYGQTVGAAAASAASFAATYALGKAAVYYLSRRHLGGAAAQGVTATYKHAFATAFSMAREHKVDEAGRKTPGAAG